MLDTMLSYTPDACEYSPISDIVSYTEDCRKLSRSFTSENQGRQKLKREGDRPHAIFQTGALVWLYVPVEYSWLLF